MKLGIFTDAHYSSAPLTCSRRYNNQSLRKIREAYDYYASEDCDLIVCLGDLTDTETTAKQEISNLADIAAIMHSIPIPTVCLMGNHDTYAFEREKFYEILGRSPVSELHLHGRRLLFLDACYSRDGRPYTPGKVDWKDTFFPLEADLRTMLADSAEDTYIFVHQNIDPAIDPSHKIHNADALFSMIGDSGCVKTVFQGHYHPGHRAQYGSVDYVTLPAMCENEFAYWIFDI
ncbi:MAG: metallophosphoesterase [Clostridia bacterium]|nr:metallophosphoesterase [Clostridia bacterium]